MIGLFGGSFDPVHHGHLIVAQVAVEALGLESLRFVPAREQPFKRGRHRSAPEHRAAMLSLAIAGAPTFTVDRTELQRPAPSYTVHTLEALRSGHPEAAPVLLLGADAASELHAWHQAERIPQLARVVVFARPGASIPNSPFIAQVIEVPAVEISATEIRRRVQQGRSIRYWVPDSVAEYIARHQLYLGPE
ncbi:MAG TPA: nicotinate-nucleotide adenylyltransferase [Gemmatimonadales bacterium]|nr:nicotinate-nucleotide adenylyltransferase [Gemmatimonadales bacterium]